MINVKIIDSSVWYRKHKVMKIADNVKYVVERKETISEAFTYPKMIR